MQWCFADSNVTVTLLSCGAAWCNLSLIVLLCWAFWKLALNLRVSRANSFNFDMSKLLEHETYFLYRFRIIKILFLFLGYFLFIFFVGLLLSGPQDLLLERLATVIEHLHLPLSMVLLPSLLRSKTSQRIRRLVHSFYFYYSQTSCTFTWW